MAMEATDIEKLIRDAFPAAQIEITDLAGDGNHYAATVVAEEFRGLNRVRQHQLVYAALGDRMREEIHALSMITLTPEQWREGSRG